jgi:hypothetical protein
LEETCAFSCKSNKGCIHSEIRKWTIIDAISALVATNYFKKAGFSSETANANKITVQKGKKVPFGLKSRPQCSVL